MANSTTDAELLERMQQEGSLGPARRTVTVRVADDLETAFSKAMVKARALFYEGYDVRKLSLEFERCDEIYQPPVELRLSPNGRLVPAGQRGQRTVKALSEVEHGN